MVLLVLLLCFVVPCGCHAWCHQLWQAFSLAVSRHWNHFSVYWYFPMQIFIASINWYYQETDNLGLAYLKASPPCRVSVSGLGFGFMSGAFSVVNILADSVGPGTVGIHGDSQHYFLSSGIPKQFFHLLNGLAQDKCGYNFLFSYNYLRLLTPWLSF